MQNIPTPLTERLEDLVTSGSALTAEVHLPGVLDQVVKLCTQLLHARYAAVGLLTPDRRSLESFTTIGISAEERAGMGELPKGHGILGVLIRDQRPLRLPDLTRHPDSAGFPPGHPPMKSFLGVPIIGRRGVIGELYLTDKLTAPEFSDEDEHLAILLATQVAAAVENARLHEESAQLLEEVQLLHRTRERFFAMVNHELRNALAAVLGWAELLTRKKDPTTVPRAAFEVLDAAEGASALINDLLDLSRLDEDRLKPVIRAVDCLSVIRHAISRVEPQANAKGVRVITEVPDEAPTCRTDAQRVEQILLNILGNAIRHTPDRSGVTITVEHVGYHVRVTVADEGPGLEPDQMERIFDVYETKAGEERQGTGLGLPLSRRLAQLLGGNLYATPRPGGGGLFTLELPLNHGEES
ncbi:MAG: ATP-binding protein [Gemmatimonadales bacterium]